MLSLKENHSHQTLTTGVVGSGKSIYISNILAKPSNASTSAIILDPSLAVSSRTRPQRALSTHIHTITLNSSLLRFNPLYPIHSPISEYKTKALYNFARNITPPTEEPISSLTTTLLTILFINEINAALNETTEPNIKNCLSEIINISNRDHATEFSFLSPQLKNLASLSPTIPQPFDTICPDLLSQAIETAKQALVPLEYVTFASGYLNGKNDLSSVFTKPTTLFLQPETSTNRLTTLFNAALGHVIDTLFIESQLRFAQNPQNCPIFLFNDLTSIPELVSFSLQSPKIHKIPTHITTNNIDLVSARYQSERNRRFFSNFENLAVNGVKRTLFSRIGFSKNGLIPLISKK